MLKFDQRYVFVKAMVGQDTARERQQTGQPKHTRRSANTADSMSPVELANEHDFNPAHVPAIKALPGVKRLACVDKLGDGMSGAGVYVVDAHLIDDSTPHTCVLKVAECQEIDREESYRPHFQSRLGDAVPKRLVDVSPKVLCPDDAVERKAVLFDLAQRGFSNQRPLAARLSRTTIDTDLEQLSDLLLQLNAPDQLRMQPDEWEHVSPRGFMSMAMNDSADPHDGSDDEGLPRRLANLVERLQNAGVATEHEQFTQGLKIEFAEF
ncbi:MAG: hypothetical protein GYB67_04970, partial [Chloroflexi bacterium]|nr:hypothetical protein [Chloroflexota bacterium]